MSHSHPAFMVAALGFCCTAVAGYDQELWDDPLSANNNWSYYDTDAPAPHDVAMVWMSSGGLGNSGCVKTPLNFLDPEHTSDAYWPAYLYRDIGNNQEIDLTIPQALITVWAKDIGMVPPVNLKGGSLHFFIGQWDPGALPGPEDDTWSFFYNLTPVKINGPSWDHQSRIQVGGDADWGTIDSNDPSVHPSDLFFHPQQWGFVILHPASQPTGELAFDSFAIVSEPAIPAVSGWGLGVMLLVLLAAGTLALRRRRVV